jgi:hypothetical protein
MRNCVPVVTDGLPGQRGDDDLIEAWLRRAIWGGL